MCNCAISCPRASKGLMPCWWDLGHTTDKLRRGRIRHSSGFSVEFTAQTLTLKD